MCDKQTAREHKHWPREMDGHTGTNTVSVSVREKERVCGRKRTCEREKREGEKERVCMRAKGYVCVRTRERVHCVPKRKWEEKRERVREKESVTPHTHTQHQYKTHTPPAKSTTHRRDMRAKEYVCERTRERV